MCRVVRVLGLLLRSEGTGVCVTTFALFSQDWNEAICFELGRVAHLGCGQMEICLSIAVPVNRRPSVVNTQLP
jgi:hypothetical protein